jgi:hypothetical protein
MSHENVYSVVPVAMSIQSGLNAESGYLLFASEKSVVKMDEAYFPAL